MKNGHRPIFFGILALSLLAPLLILRQARDCFLLPKETVTLAGLIVLACFWLVKSILSGEISLVKSPLNLPVGILTVWMLISSLWSPNHYLSFRAFLPWMSFCMIYFLTVNNVRSRRETEILVSGFAFTTLLASIYGILQFYNIDFFNWIEEPDPRRRIFSTFGNGQFLAGYLIFTLPVLAGVLFTQFSRISRLLGFLGLSAGLICLIFTWARGAWVSLAAGLIVSLLFLIGQKNRNSPHPSLTPYPASLTNSAGVRILAATYSWRHSPLKGRGLGLVKYVTLSVLICILFIGVVSFIHNAGFESDTIGGRIFTWKTGIKMIQDKPLFGWGPGSFSIVYPEYVKGSQSFLTRREWAHNDYLQAWIETGVAGLALWLWLTFLIVRRIYDTCKNLPSKEKGWAIGAGAGICSLFFYGLIFFPWHILPLGLAAFLVVGLIEANNTADIKVRRVYFSGWRRGNKVILSELIIILSLILVIIIVKPLIGDIYYRKGLKMVYHGNWNNADSIFRHALAWDPQRPELHYESGYVALKMNQPAAAAVEFNKALKGIKTKGIYYQLGLAYLSQVKMEEARDAFKDAISLDPAFTEAYNNLGVVYYNLGNKEDAARCWNRVLQIAPEDKLAKENLGKLGTVPDLPTERSEVVE